MSKFSVDVILTKENYPRMKNRTKVSGLMYIYVHVKVVLIQLR